MKIIDLRSDTITLPSPKMRQAMADAELGDDVFGEDPTVNRLQEMAAERLGMEAALLTTSGTQSNLAALLTHTRRGDEVFDELIREEKLEVLSAIRGGEGYQSLWERPR